MYESGGSCKPQILTWEQHSRNNFSVLQHVNDAALEILAAVGLKITTETSQKYKNHHLPDKKMDQRTMFTCCSRYTVCIYIKLHSIQLIIMYMVCTYVDKTI